eukprot:TRINITY_DN76219_c0_g1_i1.p1 TRINITY_DN76219_c0_g1~~TRINITY_DN76219_c0_g1_i1.p1  ORF type:complete len:131 (+),score=17.20 TRINITY_DN76219_c0_g1_i1:64-456(+)
MSMPSQKECLDIFHKYKNPLMMKATRDLPARTYLDASDQQVICRALESHPNATKKIGSGVSRIFLERRLASNGEDVCCFHVRRINGSEEDFSIMKIFGGYRGSGFDSSSNCLRSGSGRTFANLFEDDYSP